MQQINLTRVDQRFAVKAQLFDVGGFLQESGFVVSVGIDGIERLNTRRTRGLQNGAASEQQFSSFRGAFCTQVAHIVFCTEGDTDQTLGSVSDFYRAGNAQRRFNRRQQAGTAGFTTTGFFDTQDLFFDIQNILSGIGFRQTHNVRTTANDGFQVVNTPFGIQRVYTHNGFNIAIKRMLQRVVNHAAGGVFFTQCNGVFEVKHQGISRVDKGVADHRGISTRHKQHTAAGASFTLLQRSGNHWQSSHGRAGIPLARASRASSRARKMQSSAPLSSTFSCTPRTL